MIAVANTFRGRGQLLVDAVGRFYERGVVDDDVFSFCGETFAEAVTRLLEGRRTRPMLRPDQRSVVQYGRTYSANDPEVYRYR